MVGHHPTNKLIGREPIPHQKKPFPTKTCVPAGITSIRHRFQRLSQSRGQVTHVLLTRSPLTKTQYKYQARSVRLACVKHAASVRPEPGSNSPSKNRKKAITLTNQPQKGRQSINHSKKPPTTVDGNEDTQTTKRLHVCKKYSQPNTPERAIQLATGIDLSTLLSSQTSDTHHTNRPIP